MEASKPQTMMEVLWNKNNQWKSFGLFPIGFIKDYQIIVGIKAKKKQKKNGNIDIV